jgi:hypothetical protein
MENSEFYKDQLYNEEEEMSSKEYLGTFRWKKSLKFPMLKSYSNIGEIVNYSQNKKWADFLEKRLSFEIEPYIVDALSYPMSIINSLDSLKNKIMNENSTNLKFFKEKNLNLIIIGASHKAEGRIALESNYFDEIYYYLAQEKNSFDFKLNLYFVGEEIASNNSYSSKAHEKLIYNFFRGTTGDFLKLNALEFSKNNTLIAGVNCGFGAGYLKLTLSWVKDLSKLLKFNYPMIFTYTNTYEDMLGEYAIFEKFFNVEIFLKNEDNQFKSMTVYKNSEDLWSCGNHGFYIIYQPNGGDKNRLSNVFKLIENEEKLKSEVSEVLIKAGINIK